MAKAQTVSEKNAKQAAKGIVPTVGANSSAGAPGAEEQASSMTPKNFRNHPDMENFFRFIFDNDLRIEALQIIDEIIADRRAKKKKLN
jgi:hypothetical protein